MPHGRDAGEGVGPDGGSGRSPAGGAGPSAGATHDEHFARAAEVAAELSDVVYALRLQPDTAFEYVSPSVEDLVGYSPAEHYADPSLGMKLLDPRDADKLTAATRAGMDVPVEFTVRWRAKDGRTVWTTHRCRKKRRDDGSVVLYGAARDVTVEHDLTDHLFAAQNKYRLLAENSSDIVFRLDPAGVIRWVSPNVTALLDWSRWDVVGRSFSEFVNSDDMSDLVGDTESAGRVGHLARRVRLRTQEGDFRWVDVTVTEVVDDEGRRVGYVGSGADAQEQALIGQELARVSDHLRLMLDNSADVVIQVGADGTVLWVSPSMQSVFGWEPGKILGTRFRMDVAEDRELMDQVFRDAMAAHADGCSARLRVECADGTRRWVDTRNTLVWHDDGSLDSMVLSVRDVTDLVEAEDQRVAVLDSMLDPHVLLVPVRDGTGAIVDTCVADANRAACRYLQMSRAELSGKHLSDLVPADALGSMLRVYSDVLSSGEPLILDEFRHPGSAPADGADAEAASYWDIRAIKVGEALSTTWRDVSDRHAAAVALAASQASVAAVVENTSSGLVVLAAAGQIVECNRAAEDMLGLTRDQLMGHADIDPRWRARRPDGSDFPGDELPAMVTLRTGEAVRDAVIGVHKPDGSVTWITVTAIPFSMPGEPREPAVVTSFSDITQLLQAQRRLAESEDQFRCMFTEHAAVMLLVDPAGGAIVDANEAACAFYGHDRAQLCQMNIADLNELPQGEIRERMSQAKEHERNAFRFPHRLADGTTRIVEVHSSPVQGGRWLFSVIHDVTQEQAAQEALAASQQHFRLVAENATDAVIVTGLDGEVDWVSPAVVRVLGYQPEELIGGHDVLVHPEDLPLQREANQRIEAGADAVPWEFRAKVSSGDFRWMSAVTCPLLDTSGELSGLITTLRDIHERVLDRHALTLSEQTFRAAMIGAPQGMAVVALHGPFLQVNQVLCDLAGYDEAWFVAHRESDLIHPDDLEVDLRARDRLLAGDSDHDVHEGRLMVASGEALWVRHSLALVRDEYGMPMFYVSQYEDVTKARAAHVDLAFRAHHDPLTGLVNRERLHSQLGSVLADPAAGNGTVALLFCDVDHFKAVNDTYGHAVGDAVLREVATRIGAETAASDVVARLGGDEFVVVLAEVADASDAERMAEVLRRAVAVPISTVGDAVRVTMSVGISVAVPGIEPRRLLRNADAALYEAKNRGRDRSVVHAEGSVGGPGSG